MVPHVSIEPRWEVQGRRFSAAVGLGAYIAGNACPVESVVRLLFCAVLVSPGRRPAARTNKIQTHRRKVFLFPARLNLVVATL